MIEFLGGLDYEITRHVSTTDGDTARFEVRRGEPIGGGLVQGVWFDPDQYPLGIPVRLVYLQTPEKKDRANWIRALRDLQDWLDDQRIHGRALRVVLYRQDSLSRWLGDVYAGERGNTASQHMLRLGWPAYTEKR